MDYKKKDGFTRELWIPLVWMFFAGSRYLSQWLNLTPPQVQAFHEGSPLDAFVFALLIMAGIFVLSKRKIEWNLVLTKNIWIWLYFLYCGVSVVWSDYPFISLKRYIKELGNPIMVLIILTDKNPYQAMGSILRRLAFVWLPLSIVFFKYFPELGRQYHPSGTQFASGVGTEKNSLGMLCLICGIYFSCKYLLKLKKKFSWDWKNDFTDLVLVGLIAWLLQLSQSATSMVCLLVAIILLLMSRARFIANKPHSLVFMLMAFIPFFLILEEFIGLTDLVLDFLGRDENLTTRVPMWEFLMKIDINPLFGAGYQGFWLGERLETIWGFTGRTINQAHNGYLEQYLNLGYIGVLFTGVIILSGLLKVRRQLTKDYPLGMLSLCFIVSAILYNYTEASFYGINNMWLLLLFGVMDIQNRKRPTLPDA